MQTRKITPLAQSAVILVLRDSSVSISFFKKSGPYLLFSHSILSSLSFPNPLSFLHPLTSITGSGEPDNSAGQQRCRGGPRTTAGGGGASWCSADSGFGFGSHTAVGLRRRRRGAASSERGERDGCTLPSIDSRGGGGSAGSRGHGRALLLMWWRRRSSSAAGCTRRRLKMTTTESLAKLPIVGTPKPRFFVLHKRGQALLPISLS